MTTQPNSNSHFPPAPSPALPNATDNLLISDDSSSYDSEDMLDQGLIGVGDEPLTGDEATDSNTPAKKVKLVSGV